MTSSDMTKDQARAAVDLAIQALKQEDHQKRLRGILTECQAISDPMAQMQLKMERMLPVVTEILGSAIKHDNPMFAMMQVQAHAMTDPKLSLDVSKLMRALAGDLTALAEFDDEEFEEVE
jgi:3-methyladenine DNA glycosylase AlkC